VKERIALFIPSLRGGGAERVTVLLANGLVRRGVDIDLVVCEAGGVYQNDLDSSVRLVNLNVSRVAFSIIPLIKYFRDVKPYAIVSAMGYANVACIFSKLLARSKSKLLAVEHNSLAKEAKRGKKSFFLLKLMRLLYPYADEIAAVSSGAADDLSNAVGLNRDKIKVLFNPVVSDSIAQKASEAVDEEWFLESNRPVFLAVGRLTLQKDFDTLIRAFKSVCLNIPARLIILGEGEMRSELEALIEKNDLNDCVKMPGFVTNPFSYIKRSSAFVLSSRWEGLPTVLIEAMACGTPVIATDCHAGPTEILEDGRWGHLVPVGDVNALCRAMIATIAEECHPDVEKRAQDFNVEKSVTEYLKILAINY
jgi:glycosyltransferase involved in cell wall biosynthesis